MPETDDRIPPGQRLVLVTGPSGAGRSTAIKVLEDLGFEAIDNLPLTLIPRLLDGPAIGRPLALGLDPRNRDFSPEGLIALVDDLGRQPGITADVLFLDCSTEVLLRRYSETRRRHPLAPAESPEVGIARERDLLSAVRDRAGILIDTSELSPHDLRDALYDRFDTRGAARLSVLVQSFSYKRGLPQGADMVFDVRFLRNPYWREDLRPLDGQAAEVAAYVTSDPRFPAFFGKVTELADLLLPAYLDEGKTHLTIAFGCSGGQHRSVAVAEMLAKALADNGWQVSIRHRELERRASQGVPRPHSG